MAILVGGSGGYDLHFDVSTRKLGDADLDGDVDLGDVVILKKSVATGIDNGVAAVASD